MADLSKTIQIVFDAVDNTGGAFGRFGDDVTRFGAAVQDVTGPIADLTKNLLVTEAAIAAVAAVMLSTAINDAVKYESALLDLQKVMQDGDVTAYTDDIERLALAYGESATAVTQMAAEFAQAGFKMGEVFGEGGATGLVEASLVAVKVSSLEAGDAAELFKRILAGFGMEAGEVSTVLNVINEISNNTGASFEKLSEAIARVSPIAQSTGLSFEELAAMLVPVITVMGDGEKSATGLNMVLQRIGSDTKPVVDAFEALGIPLTDASGAFTSISERVSALAEKWPTLTETEKAYYAQQIAGTEQAKVLQAIFNNWSQVVDAHNLAINSAGSAQKELEIRMQATEELLKQQQVAWELLSIAIGSELLDNYKGVVSANTELLTSMQKIVESGGLKPLFDVLRPLMDEYASTVSEIGKLLPGAFEGVDWTKLEEAMKGLVDVIGSIFDGIDLTTAEGLERALQSIADAAAGLANVTAGVVEGLKPLLSIIADVAGWFIKLDPEVQKSIGYFMGLATTIDTLAGVASPIGGIFSGLGSILTAIVGIAVIQHFGGLASVLGGAGVAGTVAGAATVAAQALAAIAVALAAYEFGRWISEFTGLGNALDNLKNNAQPSSDALERMGDTLNTLSDKFGLPIRSMADFNQAVAAGKLVFNEATGQWEAAALTLGELSDGTQGAVDEQGRLYRAVVDGTGAVIQYDRAVTGADGSLLSFGGSASDASADTRKLYTELEKLASDERLKSMEFEIDLRIEQVKANAQIAVAAFESLSTTIQSTGDLLGTLYGMLGDPDNAAYVQNILDQIAKENAAREAAFKAQQDWFQANIDYLNARTDKLKSDDALIQIDGAGLQAHLEAFMFEILAAIQVKLNDEGLELLTGLQLPSPGAV
jgi:TP901 family phage tail tape measure protein